MAAGLGRTETSIYRGGKEKGRKEQVEKGGGELYTLLTKAAYDHVRGTHINLCNKSFQPY